MVEESKCSRERQGASVCGWGSRDSRCLRIVLLSPRVVGIFPLLDTCACLGGERCCDGLCQ